MIQDPVAMGQMFSLNNEKYRLGRTGAYLLGEALSALKDNPAAKITMRINVHLASDHNQTALLSLAEVIAEGELVSA